MVVSAHPAAKSIKRIHSKVSNQKSTALRVSSLPTLALVVQKSQTKGKEDMEGG
jgi:hypothetical protein